MFLVLWEKIHLDKQLKILYKIHEVLFPEDEVLECYRNKWGHWVWIPKGSVKDPFKFGIKARYENIEPRFIENSWYWVRVDV